MSWPESAIILALWGACALVLLHHCKQLRAQRGAMASHLNLNDILLIIGATLLGAVIEYLIPLLSPVYWAALAVYGTLVWLDALLFIQYRIEINRQSIMWFFTGSKGLAKGLPFLFSGLAKYRPAIAVLPLWWALSVAMGSGLGSGLLLSMLIAALTLVAMTPAMRLPLRVLFVMPLVVALAYLLNLWSLPVSPSALAVVAISAASVVLILALLRVLFVSQHPFLTAPSLLPNIVADDSFDAQAPLDWHSAHRDFVTPVVNQKAPSPFHGRCQGANIILITLESLGAYIPPYTQDAARSRLAERFQSHRWLSRQHFCLCPNTTVSTNQMYTGAYSNNPYNKDDSLFPGGEPQHLSVLKQAGYKTLFLDSADIALYDYHKLLSRIGFDRVWGTDDLPGDPKRADYRLWDMVEPIADAVGDGPFFLHVINDQTHMPYQVVDAERFSRHKGDSQKALYLNAVEEVDYILDVFLTKLGERLDLSDTLLVFTGDHGESFGEYGYRFHSNSVIPAQMQVPFMLRHPALDNRELTHSCHFDLFPTFFDLLGLDWQHDAIGASLGHDDRPFKYFFHSATLKGNSPANFGFLDNGELLWMDRLFNQINLLQQSGQVSKVAQSEKAYQRSLLFHMLKARGIVA